MKDKILILIIAIVTSSSLNAQGLTKKQLDQYKRTSRTNNHIEVEIEGKIKGHVFISPSFYLGRIVVTTKGKKNYYITFPSHQGEMVKKYAPVGENVKLTVKGDELLLGKILVKNLTMKRVEKEHRLKLTGMGKLYAISSSKGIYEFNKPFESKFSVDRSYTVIADAKIISRSKINKEFNQLVIENGDTLRAQTNSNVRGFYANETVTYVRPEISLLEGTYYKYRHTYQLVTGLYLFNGIVNLVLPSMGRNSIFLNQTKGKFEDYQADNRGKMSGADFQQLDGKRINIYFDPENGLDFKNYIEKFQGSGFELFHTKTTLTASTKDPTYNILYGIRAIGESEIMSLEKQRSFFSKSEHYEKPEKEMSGTITKIFRSENKKSGPFEGLLIDDNIYLTVSQIMAINTNSLIRVGENIEFIGWERKKRPKEVDLKNRRVFIIRSLTIDGKTFTQEIKDIDKQW